MAKSCQECSYFTPIDSKYGRCNCPEAGGGHSLVVEIMENCEFFKNDSDSEPEKPEK